MGDFHDVEATDGVRFSWCARCGTALRHALFARPRAQLIRG
jgi:hypothetical protein